ncbi:DeoR/GlpR family DNA-binding transcription regulator [Kribbella shirazensis]|uniref:Lactose phosphotransferase system repressor n=1 Tax=Kribbella shirazensis TaxID=1105143 RepID=A0A7X5VHW4_9ACTN|nr:DeoR/GlpR family DNA-binding transcription regulator [Kribbella shirazensis]NIK61497.1 DeoR family fructose operon transcriptional repressor [Kribbella shirazensis]
MYAEERLAAIVGKVRDQGRVTVSGIAADLGVTTETVRRDLAQLERGGLLRRVHGGAVSTTALTVIEPGVAERDATSAEQKDRIAKAAIGLLPGNGGSILLDAGTTTARIASLLPVDRRLVVVTNAVPIAARLGGADSVRLHLLGGRVRGETQAAVGEQAVGALADLRVDLAFVGTNALTVDHGLTTPDPDEAAVKRAMVAAAHQVVVVADSSKIGHEHLVRFASIDDIDVLITDDGIDRTVVRELERREVEVVVA